MPAGYIANVGKNSGPGERWRKTHCWQVKKKPVGSGFNPLSHLQPGIYLYGHGSIPIIYIIPFLGG
jgi:hypothetical protein